MHVVVEVHDTPVRPLAKLILRSWVWVTDHRDWCHRSAKATWLLSESITLPTAVHDERDGQAMPPRPKLHTHTTQLPGRNPVLSSPGG
jgi:hypothetical protein